MKITCTNCRKSYIIDETKVSPKAKAARCRSCGNLVPLKRATKDPHAFKIRTIKVSCRNCGKNYVLRQDKVPPGTASFRCKTCRRPVSLPSPDKESQPTRSEPIAIKAQKSYSFIDGKVHVTCPGCQKRYKIHQNNIPSDAIAVNCRICEHKISLPSGPEVKTTDHQGFGENRRHKTPPTMDFRDDVPPPIDKSRKKSRLPAMAVSVLLVLFVGILAAALYLNMERLDEIIPWTADKKTAKPNLPKKDIRIEQIAGMKLMPTVGPVETRYIQKPHFVTTVDVDSLKPELPRIFKQRLFPGHFWDFGKNPQMTLDLDPVDIPNATMAELNYKVTSILSPDGEDVLRIDEGKLKTTIHPGSMFPGSLALNIKRETPPDALGTARINFQLSIPDAIEIFDFKAGTKNGSIKTANGIQVTLELLEKDVAQVAYAGGKTARLIAFDQTGRPLASKENLNSSSSAATRFEGVIATLQVVIAGKIHKYAFDVEVDLNAGQELALARKPEVPLRTRYNHKLPPVFIDLAEKDLENLEVRWKEADDGALTDSLLIQLPKGPCSGHANWEVHFFGQNQPQLLTGNPIQGMRDFSFRLEKGKLKKASAVFGIVQLDFKTGIKRLRFVNNHDGVIESRRLPSGDSIHVSFNKNEITYSAGNADIIQTAAYDAADRRLKQDNYTRNKGGKRKVYFWGVPATFDLDVATDAIKKQISFDIKQRSLDESAYRKFKQKTENQREIVATLKALDRARRRDRSYYGDDLAGLYYLFDHANKKPMQLIDKTIAHSDPAGQKRFHYKLTPYKGYYFTVLSGVQAGGLNEDYKRQPRKSEFLWEKGTIKTSSLTRHPDLVAIPADKSQPTFFLQWGQVYMKPLYGVELKYLPEYFTDKGWSQTAFVDG